MEQWPGKLGYCGMITQSRLGCSCLGCHGNSGSSAKKTKFGWHDGRLDGEGHVHGRGVCGHEVSSAKGKRGVEHRDVREVVLEIG
jgi:hypothetical protein